MDRESEIWPIVNKVLEKKCFFFKRIKSSHKFVFISKTPIKSGGYEILSPPLTLKSSLLLTILDCFGFNLFEGKVGFVTFYRQIWSTNSNKQKNENKV